MAQQKTTFGGVDILRFLAAVLVMFYHHGYWVWAFPAGVSARAIGGIPPHPELEMLGSRWGRTGVFVISGFVIAFSAETRPPCGFSRQG
ncbi:MULTISPECIES: hypothetical protein [unclassified Mesorhizobium]|uniref:hypothetical protein n=1 Tax=unclassified Mesorhizobium TaxID=325217 RepID=UPI001FDF7751|nr:MULTISPECIES: hypothetical protein [unclassified Mesorhizobium]